MKRRTPITIIPDYEFKIPDFRVTSVSTSIGSFRYGPGVLTFYCNDAITHNNVRKSLYHIISPDRVALASKGMTSKDVMIQTSVGHELRHFQDWLLSFNLFNAGRRKLFLAANTLQTFRFYPKEESEVLFPLPFLNWMVASKEQRDLVIDSFREFCGDPRLQICSFPSFNIDMLNREAEPGWHPFNIGMHGCLRSAISVRNVTGISLNPSVFGPSDLFELSAISTQLYSIVERYGITTAKSIYDAHLAGTYYDSVFMPITRLINKKYKGFIQQTDVFLLASAMCLWSICSAPTFGQDQSASDPALRFLKLRIELLKNRARLVKELRDIEGLLSYFDKIMNEEPIDVRVRQSTNWFRNILVEMKELGRKGDRKNVFFEPLLIYWEKMIQIREKTVEILFENIGDHIRGRFGHERAHELIHPPIFIDCRGSSAKDKTGSEEDALFAKYYAGSTRRIGFSDNISGMEAEISNAHLGDVLSSKLYFDEDIAGKHETQLVLDDFVKSQTSARATINIIS